MNSSGIVLVDFASGGQLFFGFATARTVMSSTSRLDPLTAGGASNGHNVDVLNISFRKRELWSKHLMIS